MLRKEVRRALSIERPKTRARVVARLSRDEERRLIAHAYRMKGMRGLLIKTLLQTGTRVSEFVNIKVEEFREILKKPIFGPVSEYRATQA